MSKRWIAERGGAAQSKQDCGLFSVADASDVRGAGARNDDQRGMACLAVLALHGLCTVSALCRAAHLQKMPCSSSGSTSTRLASAPMSHTLSVSEPSSMPSAAVPPPSVPPP